MPNSYTRKLTYNGETLTVNEWAARLGMNPGTLYRRVTRSGWSDEKALTTPIDPTCRTHGSRISAVWAESPATRGSAADAGCVLADAEEQEEVGEGAAEFDGEEGTVDPDSLHGRLLRGLGLR